MSMNLAFWKYNDGIYLNNQEVYERACVEEESVEGLSILLIDEILNKVSEVFIDYDNLGDYNFESSKGSFSVFTTDRSVLFDCKGMFETELNKIIDIMAEFDCPLYDPQITTRFDGR